MEKHQHPFDDFLKETLKGHHLVPREEARKAFLEEAATIHHPRRGWFRWYYLLVLLVVISGIIAVVSYFGSENELPVADIQNEIPIVEPKSSPSPDSNPSILKINNEPIPETASVPEKQIPEDEIPSPSSQNTVKASATDKQEADAIPTSALPSQPDTVAEQPPVSYVPAAKDTAITSIPAYEPKEEQEIQKRKENTFAASAYYLPEYMFNTLEGGKFVNNFGVDFTFYRGRTSIRTGAGISISQGVTAKAVEYNEFLGTYNKLDSITFVFNESEGEFYSSIYTSSENVWDSISLYDSTEIINRYTYLQVPLILGFDFWEKGRLTVGVRIGTIMSVMLKSQQLTGEYDAGANQVVGISTLSPDQVSVNWQALGGINGTLLLTRSLYLEIEPQAKYYYQSIYEKSGYEKKPWSIGLRTSILFKF